VWFRGRTVAAMMVLTTIAASLATYAYFELPDWGLNSAGIEEEADPLRVKDGLRQKELDKFNKALSLIERRFMTATDRDKLLDGAIQGMVESLHDPYSVYKTAEEAEKFNEAIQRAYTGIGAELGVENGAIIVEAPIRGSPAERAGLKPRDILLSINGESLHGLPLSEVIAKIRGPKGTKAKLKVQRNGAIEPLDIELVRDRIDLATVSSHIEANGIAYLQINQFTDDTATQVAAELKALEDSGFNALIIDVRDNPGGMLQSAIEVADQFLEKGKPIVQYEYKDGKLKVDTAGNGAKSKRKYPIVVLVNKGSASAAEILAGALKQSANAVLLGETTFGKGKVQVSYHDELGDRSLIKLTVYKWLLPDGTWADSKGIKPDITVVQPDYFLASRLPREYVLKFDSTGEAVKNLQNILAGVGFPADRTDGYFSRATQTAIEQFQASESLPVTGEVNVETAQRLEEVLYRNLENPDYDKQRIAALTKARELIQASP